MLSRLLTHWLRTGSLTEKLRRINLVTTGGASVIAILLLTTYGYWSLSSQLLEDSQVKTQLIGRNSASALLFDDAKAAGDLLNSLEADAQVLQAALWDRAGQRLTSYRSALQPADELVSPPSLGYTLGLSVLDVAQLVSVDGRPVGTVALRLDLSQLYQRLLSNALAFALVILIALALSHRLLARFNRAITAPISSLVSVMARISQQGDYAVRAPVESNDEIGDLAKGFNVMLEEIEDRDRHLAAHRDELEQEVEARTADLRQSRDLAEAGSRAKSEFLATMSHEIRTPMNGILGMTEMLRHTALNLQQQRFADAVYQSGEHLLTLINDILDFSKIEAGKLDIECIHFNLRQLVEDLGCLFAQPAEAKGLEMICSVPHDLPVAVSGDPVRVRQILTNLMNNAVKFTSRGDIVIRVRLLDETPQQACFRFEVQDSGIGISEEAQARLFNAFVQADSSTTRRFGGTGLGLVIAKRLIEMMHGQIGLHSEAGRGTLFWFEIPLRKQNPDARSVMNMAERLNGLRVLVVDDNATNREILAHQLAGWSMHYTGAAEGQQALQDLDQTAERPFDLAILDLHMPGMDGFELARAIRRDARWARMPLVMLSSVSVGADHPDRRNAPIDYYLTKPVRQSDLCDAIATALSRETPTPASAPPSPGPVPHAGALPARLGGRVLVAEDNPVNQAVAGAMLESLGVSYRFADSGQIALDRVLHEPFDLVLMDCQMPEMDGFEATVQIRARQREGLLRQRLPIVALTANAVAGDRERCLAAGMDDYLSKPFTREGLLCVLQRWLPQPSAATVKATADASARSTPTASGSPLLHEVATAAIDEPINPRALDAIRHLPGPNGALLVQKVIGAYLADTPARFAQLRAATDAGDADALRKAAHALKSSSANVGADPLAALYKELETLGRQGTVDGAGTLLAAAEAELARVLTVLAATLVSCPEKALAGTAAAARPKSPSNGESESMDRVHRCSLRAIQVADTRARAASGLKAMDGTIG
ncbi:MAG: response regulator [Candidatus Accumulibacter sp.]|uniref:Virulence sensor protein BvgS n=1 Tax=Candidatus Accumulibacter proximus TaxID=2954385 RepID=A0A935PYZ9_9PROT|nr:response regulator [Candidatus Accumulibacter proximus]